MVSIDRNLEPLTPLCISTTYTLLDIDRELPALVDQPIHEDSFFHAPDFDLSNSRVLHEPPITLEDTHHAPRDVKEEDLDIWLLPNDYSIPAASYHSWDSFDNDKDKKPRTSYITEAGPTIFDAALGGDPDDLPVGNSDTAVVDSKIYASSIVALGLGRSSVLFTWNDDKSDFTHTLPRMRISGYTSECIDGLLSTFMDCGTITKNLQNFVDTAYAKKISPGQIALADAVSTLLRTIQSCLSKSCSSHKSILQLQALFQPAHGILTCFQRIVSNTSRTLNDESMLSAIFEEVQLQEHRTDSLSIILFEILGRVSQPWLEFVSEWLGLRIDTGLPLTKEGNGKSFVKVTDKEWVDEQGLELQARDYVLDYERVPSFITPEDARTMFEVGKSLRLLKSHHPEHPLASPEVITSANPPPLNWEFSWQDIVNVESKALQYEKDLTETLQRLSNGSSILAIPEQNSGITESNAASDFFALPNEDLRAQFPLFTDIFIVPLGLDTSLDRLSNVLIPYLISGGESTQDSNSIFSPPVSLTPVLAFNPLVSAQARIVNGTCMRMFFNSHNLRQHLSLQRSFHLLGNGVFSSRLSHALFDPDLESAERHRGVARSGGVMGLRLGGRDTWPPASSELRLALMGVLSDSYVSNIPLQQTQTGGYLENSLPGDLSFAVRDMSDEEIEKCMNADSIEALDFLRLSYKPPAPLEAVITPMILFKYDQLFKLLLRVLRILYVVSTLFRDATDRTSVGYSSDPIAGRFRVEAQHFVTSIAGYFFDTGIEATWRIFDRKLDEIETRINSDDNNITLGQNEGLDKLREYHERVLDRIMFALLLRKRQQPVLQLLEEIFVIVLQFSRWSRERSLGVKTNYDIDEMYLRFRKKVGVFITVCRGLDERKGYGEKKAMGPGQGGLFDGDDLVEENTIGHLLARLEMSNYYARTVTA
jgi:hypothetical protein